MKTSENISVTNYTLQYIAGPMGLAAIYVVNTPLSGGAGMGLYYTHTDHVSILLNINLGSITEITNEQGQLVQRMAYNAWGIREPLQDNAGCLLEFNTYEKMYNTFGTGINGVNAWKPFYQNNWICY